MIEIYTQLQLLRLHTSKKHFVRTTKKKNQFTSIGVSMESSNNNRMIHMKKWICLHSRSVLASFLLNNLLKSILACYYRTNFGI